MGVFVSYCFETEGSVLESTSPLVSWSGILNEVVDVMGRRIGCILLNLQETSLENREVEFLIQIEERRVGSSRRVDMFFLESELSTFKE